MELVSFEAPWLTLSVCEWCPTLAKSARASGLVGAAAVNFTDVEELVGDDRRCMAPIISSLSDRRKEVPDSFVGVLNGDCNGARKATGDFVNFDIQLPLC